MHYFSRPKQLIMRNLLLTAALIPALFASAQRYEQKLDAVFKPTDVGGRYHAITEKTDSGWHRTAVYIPEKTRAMEGLYEDRECKVASGTETWYHSNGRVQSTGRWVNGKKQGTWREYYENGVLRDSVTYADGKVRGLRLTWYDDGSRGDSTVMDATGNGIEIGWHKGGGGIYLTGQWTLDTMRHGRWQYFHPNGQLWATEEYDKGKRLTVACYDSTGVAQKDCEFREATFPGEAPAWRRFLERNLNAAAPVDNGAPAGAYTVIVQFIVDKDGSISDVKALTNHGYGMEKELVRLISVGPSWVPASMFGKPVKAYRKQPVTFVVQESTRKAGRRRER
jgi:hypothetical protein